MRRKSLRGFTLLELTISLCILTIGLLSLAMIFPLGLKAGSEATHLTSATILAQQRIEDIKRGEKNIWNPSVAIPPYCDKDGDGIIDANGLVERRWYNSWDDGITDGTYYEDIAETTVGEPMPPGAVVNIPLAQFGRLDPLGPNPNYDDPYASDNATFTDYYWLASVERLPPVPPDNKSPENILKLTLYIIKPDATAGGGEVTGRGYREEKFVTYLVRKE